MSKNQKLYKEYHQLVTNMVDYYKKPEPKDYWAFIDSQQLRLQEAVPYPRQYGGIDQPYRGPRIIDFIPTAPIREPITHPSWRLN
jgi:hypothetical protein